MKFIWNKIKVLKHKWIKINTMSVIENFRNENEIFAILKKVSFSPRVSIFLFAILKISLMLTEI